MPESNDSKLSRLRERIPALAVIGLICLIVILGLVIAAKASRMAEEKQKEKASGRPPVNVVVLTLTPGPISDRMNLPATVEPRESVVVKAEVRGKVIEVIAAEGQSLAKGALIARIDPRDYEINLMAAQAEYDKASRAMARAEALHSKGITPDSDLDTARAQADSFKAQLEAARLALERTRLVAPIPGILNRLDAKEGVLLAQGDPVGVVMEIDSIKIVVGIPESDVSAVRKRDSFEVKIEALGGRRLTGRKLFLASSPSNMAHLYRLELLAPNPGREVLPGMFARAEIIKEEFPDGLAVPLYAVISQGQRKFVYIEEKGIARMRDVVTGVLEGWRIHVREGLKPGDRVIVVGHRSLSEGQSVNVMREATNIGELAQ